MRISDWSSDVCSSDLAPRRAHQDPYMRGGTHMFAIRKDRVSFTGLAKGASVLALGFATSAVAQTTTTQDPAASTPREARANVRSEEHTSELQSLMRISYAVFCLTKKKHKHKTNT